jgi:hypothetical protein
LRKAISRALVCYAALYLGSAYGTIKDKISEKGAKNNLPSLLNHKLLLGFSLTMLLALAVAWLWDRLFHQGKMAVPTDRPASEW